MSEPASPSARTPGDLVAMTPYLMGFTPRDCLILHGLTGGDDVITASLHFQLAQVAEGPALVLPDLAAKLKRNGCERVAVLAYGPPPRTAPVLRIAVAQLSDADIRIADLIQVEGSRFISLSEHDPDGALAWSEIPVAPPSVAALIAIGATAPAPDRTARAAVLAPADPLARAAVSDALSREPSDGDVLIQRRRDLELIDRWERSDQLPGPEDIAALALALCDLDLRDHVIVQTAENPPGARQDLWVWVLRHVPEDLVPNVALVAAVCCYLRGDGPLAGDLLGTALTADPDHFASKLLRRAVMIAMPPAKVAQALTRRTFGNQGSGAST